LRNLESFSIAGNPLSPELLKLADADIAVFLAHMRELQS
jgi:hypothetical protein